MSAAGSRADSLSERNSRRASSLPQRDTRHGNCGESPPRQAGSPPHSILRQALRRVDRITEWTELLRPTRSTHLAHNRARRSGNSGNLEILAIHQRRPATASIAPAAPWSLQKRMEVREPPASAPTRSSRLRRQVRPQCETAYRPCDLQARPVPGA